MRIDSTTVNQIEIQALEIFKPNEKKFFAYAKKDKIDFVYNTSGV